MKLTDIKQALEAYQTGHYPKHGDASRVQETLTKALPHLIAIAEAAERIANSRHAGPNEEWDEINTGELDDLTTALNELEKA